jgi:SAM-dependent methyltransferase
MDTWDKIKVEINNFEAIEIGGPTILFQSSMILYNILKSVDGINMKKLDFDWPWPYLQKEYYYYGERKGTQFEGDASDIDKLNIDKKYDIIITSHLIEHIANPIKALKSWKKLLKDDGHILSILPNKNEFWDKVREYTTIDHMIEDYKNDIGEDDMTHYEENLMSNKSNRDYKKYSVLSKDNFRTRFLHHHCFNDQNTKEMFEYAGYNTIYCFVYEKDPLQIVYFGKK